MTLPLLNTIRHWTCPNCGATATTNEPRPHTKFHTCPKLRFLTAPMVPAGTKAKVVAHEREDYVGSELVQTDEAGRPVMSITTERDDGQDAVVFAPTATARGAI